MNRVTSKTTLYTQCVIWIKDEASARDDGGRSVWMVGRGCGRGLSGCVFVIGVKLGYCDGILLKQEMGVSLSPDMELYWGNLKWTIYG